MDQHSGTNDRSGLWREYFDKKEKMGTLKNPTFTRGYRKRFFVLPHAAFAFSPGTGFFLLEELSFRLSVFVVHIGSEHAVNGNRRDKQPDQSHR